MSGITKGNVVDPSGQVLANCQLFMYRRTDGTLLGSAISDENGNYELTHQGANGEQAFIVCLDNDDAPNFEGLVHDRIAITVETNTISCAGATYGFGFRTDLNLRTIEASVNGSDWAEISTFNEISALLQPTDFGAKMVISMNTSDDTRVKLRASSDVCLFVNPAQEVDDVNQSNKAYTLYDANGKAIDPMLEENKTYNSSYIDDSSTDQDYVVLFRSVDFCLSNSEGAGSSTDECSCTSDVYVQPVSFAAVTNSKMVAEISINGKSPTSSLPYNYSYEGSIDNLIAKILAFPFSDGNVLGDLLNIVYSEDNQTFTTENKTTDCLHDVMLRLQIFDSTGNQHLGTTDFIPAYTSLCPLTMQVEA